MFSLLTERDYARMRLISPFSTFCVWWKHSDVKEYALGKFWQGWQKMTLSLPTGQILLSTSLLEFNLS
jgi:hypothetical protein